MMFNNNTKKVCHDVGLGNHQGVKSYQDIAVGSGMTDWLEVEYGWLILKVTRKPIKFVFHLLWFGEG